MKVVIIAIFKNNKKINTSKWKNAYFYTKCTKTSNKALNAHSILLQSI